ncbi:hypothetical protein AAFF_G00082630 [Aldrovandia affinis]|uniref:Dynein heavy chain tail domain-containing protein n=1 Tax=Aldrovandia affinis TaxID=143900 RepID=A0AAD7WXY7_9TELE|nr:hypothetical protein AAFF_G00082630 [Aldrovandia affinis]
MQDLSSGSKDVLTPDSIQSNLCYGDLSYSPLDQFSALVEEVVVPILSNKRNHCEWPHVVSQDIKQHVHSLKTNVFVVAGQVRGKTLLPLPAGSERVEQAALERDKSGDLVDKSIIHSIESVVIEWSHQIREVLKKDSSEPLLEGKSPTPHVELLFWKNRYADLECIYGQLKSTKVSKMSELLERMESSYYPAFRNMFQDVLAALEEARDINIYLKPLQRLFEGLESVEFSEIKSQISPLMHTVCLLWANSKYYNTPARIIVLLQEICNLLIQQARAYLNPEDMLKGETEESLAKVQGTMDILHHFRQTYDEMRGSLGQYQKNGQELSPWDFSPTMVFAGMDQFIQRVQSIEAS